ncbi:MAG TPA: DNA-directed RNA polymerase subunit alpha C-terminal domain-containing protein [Planctomycetota bacterium]|nr:DNA-directed RNA polymerase subunit alpha C-terminal domain-containing protein [Planctomycetota bacterium]
MADAAVALDLKGILTTEDLAPDKLHEVRREVHCHVDLRNQLDELLAEFGSKVAKALSSENKAEIRRGASLWLLGKSEEAIKVLEPARVSKERSYILGVSYLEAGRPQDALAALKEASEADGSDAHISAAYCEAKIRAGKYDEAETHVDKLLKKDGAQGFYLKGLLADLQGYHDEGMKSYEKALEIEPGHPSALFRLAYIMDRFGEDSRALELYEQLRKMRPMHLNTVMNLGVLYEDRGEYERAIQCYQTVLDYYPGHGRAGLYLKDAQASLTMFYDEDAARREAKVAQILGQPVAEISFSPRVRTALQKLGVNSLADLVAKSEEDLLQIPNFGRTSLRELKEFLSSKGLSLASASGPGGIVEPAVEEAPVITEGPVNEETLKKNLSDFEWSGRIRKVYEKMGVVTVGDLLKRTEKDLLKSKNLGVTSIKEIRKKLGQLGVSMKPE